MIDQKKTSFTSEKLSSFTPCHTIMKELLNEDNNYFLDVYDSFDIFSVNL